MKRNFPLFALVPLLLSCGGPSPSSPDASSVVPSESDPAMPSTSVEPSFTSKEINVFYVDSSLNQKATLRFYENSADVPYISIADFYALLLKGRSADESRAKLMVSHNGGVYTVAARDGSASFNVDDNTFSCDNLSFFISTKTYEEGYKALMGTDGMPWMKVDTIDASGEAKKTYVDFNDYHIDIHGDGDALYLPLPTLQDLFSDTSLLTSLYNRKDLYVYNVAFEDTRSFGLDVYEPCLKTDLGTSYAKYLYNEMCFDYDVLLGRPTRSSLERYYDLSKGLDAALDSRPYGKLAKQYLTDGTALGYATGLQMMGYLFLDGGHSNVTPFRGYNYDPERKISVRPSWYNSIYSKVFEVIDSFKDKGYEEYDNRCQTYSHHGEINANRREKLGLSVTHGGNLRGEETYKKINDTAFIFIDDYMGDFLNAEEWKKYYAGTGDLPYGEHKGGAVVSIFKGLTKAHDDPSVKNIVVDLSGNTGGSVDEMMYLVSLLTANKSGEATIDINNRVTGQNLKAHLKIDRNLDKVFDERDAEMNLVEGKRLAVLMSQNGFSCGGISPILLHDRGLFTMGDDSGGGCCSVFYQHTGVGLPTVRSSGDAIIDKNGKKIDLAREGSCDHKFPIKPGSGEDELDFSAFFDIDSIEEAIAAHYAA